MKEFIKKYYIIFIPLILASISSIFIDSTLDGLNLPLFMPPEIVFPIVWSILYLLMGLSIYLVKDSLKCNIIFWIQLIINLSWSFLFFNFSLFFIAILIIMLLIFLVNIMLVTFSQIEKKAYFLNIPYLLWLLIAFYLSCGIYFLN